MGGWARYGSQTRSNSHERVTGAELVRLYPSPSREPNSFNFTRARAESERAIPKIKNSNIRNCNWDCSGFKFSKCCENENLEWAFSCIEVFWIRNKRIMRPKVCTFSKIIPMLNCLTTELNSITPNSAIVKERKDVLLRGLNRTSLRSWDDWIKQSCNSCYTFRPKV